ncbi:palmitoyltransferase ZDHHC1 [Synchiropus picturatus]
MDTCSPNPNRTAPAAEEVHPPGDMSACSRTNGWSWPPHPLQLLAWLLYVYFAVTGLGVFVPLLPRHWIPAGYICTGIMFVCHLCVHVMAVSIDPADHNVRAKSHKGPVPVFDRTKHAHVIENCHCYLCQVDVGPKSKHCSSCNKCVSNFDHHCRWLNNCVGSRNYKLFLHSVVSALVGVLLVLVVASYVFIEFFLDPTKLRTDGHFLGSNQTGVWFVFLPVSPVRAAPAVIPVLAVITICLTLLSSVLLTHLLCFHVYLMWNRLSTYEYIVRQRHRQDSRESRRTMKEATAPPGDTKDGEPPGVLDQPGTLVHSGAPGYTNQQQEEDQTVEERVQYVSNGRVRCVSSPVLEEDAPSDNLAEERAHQHMQKKKKRRKVRRVQGDLAGLVAPPPESTTLSTVSLSQRLPFPAFPLRVSLPPLAPSSGPVQAAAPPAEYHSDSAESLEEIPVALSKLGSSSSMAAGGELHRAARAPPSPSPLPRTKRKSARSDKTLRMELTSKHHPVVFVSRTSAEAGPV